MARLPYVTREQLPESEGSLFDEIEAQFRVICPLPLMLS